MLVQLAAQHLLLILGDFLGTTGFTDTLNFTNGATTLTNDVLQDVNVNVASGATLDVDGARTIDGNLVSDGALDFVLGTDSLTVTGDTILNAGSFRSDISDNSC